MRTMRRLLQDLRGRWTIVLHDLVMIPVAWLAAYWLRYNLGEIPPAFLHKALQLAPLAVAVQGGVFILFGLYRGVWRFASIPDLLRIFKAVAFGTLLLALVVFLVTRMQHVPRSVFILYPMLLAGLVGGPRFLYRLFKDRKFKAEEAKRVLVVGAGSAGEMLVRDLLRNEPRRYEPIAFVDDDRRKLGKEIHGVRVVGTTEEIGELARRLMIDVLLLAVPSASADQMRAIVERCEASGVPFRTLPRLDDLLSGRARISALREVSIDDLLGREAVSLDWSAIRAGLAGRSVLVTGGGGSIGSELCRQIAEIGPRALVIYERNEFNLYGIESELRLSHPHLTLHAVLGDVCDEAQLAHTFAAHEPEVVFHAAAYKHVPMLERQKREALRNNVLGTQRVARAAEGVGCDAFVLISTDKAVNPTNVMGASKRIAELYCQTLNPRSGVRYITVRFGNVLGSTGSVVPLFQRQIARGGPVTVTHPDVTRYFMTTAEACQLILQACVMGAGGEIYVLDMGRPVKIRYLAEQMIRLSGKLPEQDIPIVYTGLRPGEKLYEELFHPDEEMRETGHDKILLASSRQVGWTFLTERLQRLEQACRQYDEATLDALVRELVPEMSAGGGARPAPNLRVIK